MPSDPTPSVPVSGEQHERAVEAARGQLWSGRTEDIIDAYHRSLAEQGVVLVDLHEVVEFVQDLDEGDHVLFSAADALEHHFGSHA